MKNSSKIDFQAFVDTASDLMHIADENEVITYVNYAMADTLQYSKQEMIGMHISQITNKEHEGDNFDQSKEELIAQGSITANPVWITEDGREVHGEAKAVAVYDDEGKFAGSRVVFRDITERKRAEEASPLLNRQIIHADKMISLGILTSGVAHEINNPNQFIMSHISPLKKIWEDAIPILERYYKEHGDFILGGGNYSSKREQVPSMFSSITKGSNRIKTIIEELREYARDCPIDKKESIQLNKVVESALTLLSNHVAKSTKHFSLNLRENIPSILGNYQRIEQVAINLIQNSCQALLDDNAGIYVSTYYDDHADNVILEVTDEGIGISKDDLPYITDPFFTTKRSAGGTGLGLSISSSIIAQHSGTIRFARRINKGTKVIVSLPALREGVFSG
ncbi:MAG: PAS domain S-box protein [Proteobacteria bacterium]|nr:PAS domain S-box protein [Pseudomonadota bacterium]